MGVPAFYRWLSERYPKVISNVIEEVTEVEGEEVPVNTAAPNPNGIEFDNLYLDMNGIIHPCTHPEDGPAPKTEADMMELIFKYIDRLFGMIRPRKLLYMAIDGVAPRAKMNQQRTRRFRAAKENKEKRDLLKELAEKYKLEGKLELADEAQRQLDEEPFDSNVITPGTEFMDLVAKSVTYYAAARLQSDPGWKGIKVIISDANVPGEGEHKIMEFIRRQRMDPAYDPHTRHVVCGLDADLIMLGLSTHEPYFHILREEVNHRKGNRTCNLCGQVGHIAKFCNGKPRNKDQPQRPLGRKPFQLVDLAIVREYLEKDMKPREGAFNVDKIVDDFVLLCFFVGNDFLPHMPTLSIKDNAINLLMGIYRRELPFLDGYLTEEGKINFQRVKKIMQNVAEQEDTILRKRRDLQLIAARQREERKKRRYDNQNDQAIARTPSSGVSMPGNFAKEDSNAISKANRSAADLLRNRIKASSESDDGNASESSIAQSTQSTGKSGAESNNLTQTTQGVKRSRDEFEPQNSPKPDIRNSGESSNHGNGKNDAKNDSGVLSDDVRLGEEGYRFRYYKIKFEGEKLEGTDLCKDVAIKYIKGLQWVFRYYYTGCCSWSWFYKYHYAPFATDLANIDDNQLDFDFELGEPFHPFEQLMSVLPAASAKALPKPLRPLMTESSSPIHKFYPETFRIDMEGCTAAWQGVVILEHIDEKELLKAIHDISQDPNFELTEEEKRRNEMGCDRILARIDHYLGSRGLQLYENNNPKIENIDLTWVTFIEGNGCDIRGTISKTREYVPLDDTFECPYDENQKSVKNKAVVVCKFENGDVPEGYKYQQGLLPNAQLPPTMLSNDDGAMEKNWNQTQRFMNRRAREELAYANGEVPDEDGYTRHRSNRYGNQSAERNHPVSYLPGGSSSEQYYYQRNQSFHPNSLNYSANFQQTGNEHNRRFDRRQPQQNQQSFNPSYNRPYSGPPSNSRNDARGNRMDSDGYRQHNPRDARSVPPSQMREDYRQDRRVEYGGDYRQEQRIDPRVERRQEQRADYSQIPGTNYPDSVRQLNNPPNAFYPSMYQSQLPTHQAPVPNIYETSAAVSNTPVQISNPLAVLQQIQQQIQQPNSPYSPDEKQQLTVIINQILLVPPQELAQNSQLWEQITHLLLPFQTKLR